MKIIIISAAAILFCNLFTQTLTVETIDGSETIELNEIENIIVEAENLIFVEGGFYLMGDHYNEGWSDELPVHSITVDNFFIGKFEITHTEFIEFLNDAEVEPDGSYNGYDIIDMDDTNCAIVYSDDSFVFNSIGIISSSECPIINVSWYGACEYSNWLSETNNLTPSYTIDNDNVECAFEASGFRLATEAEWEYACRGGVSWTDDYRYSGCHEWIDFSDYGWFNYNSASQLHPVGEKLPNQLGIFDMSGNVYELCWDWFSSSYYEVSPSHNPTGPDSGSYHVSRGGDWNDDAQFCRSSARFSSYPYNTGGYLGFRLVKSY